MKKYLDALPPNLSSGKVDTAERKIAEEARICVQFPAFLLHVDHASNDHVSDLAAVSEIVSVENRKEDKKKHLVLMDFTETRRLTC